MMEGNPFLPMKCWNANKNDSIESRSVRSRCSALVEQHVNKHTYTLDGFDDISLAYRGPAKSILTMYSGFYLRGPNFCEICEVLMSSQILILKLLFYFREPATEHVILAPGYPRKHI